MAAAPPQFALHPADAIQGMIDLTTREGVKLYQNATRSFYTDPADFFNCEAPGLHGFLKEVEGRAPPSDGAMRSSRSQMISRLCWEEQGISSRTMVNFHLITYVNGKPPIYTEYQEQHKTRPTYTSAL